MAAKLNGGTIAPLLGTLFQTQIASSLSVQKILINAVRCQMARKHPPSFDLFITDFRDGVRKMTLEQVGAYILLLIEQFETGQLPNNPSVLCGLCQHVTEKEFERIWSGIAEKFEETDDGQALVNPKMAEVREKTWNRWKTNVENGKKGGRPKATENPSDNPNGNPNGNPNETAGEGGREKREVKKKGSGKRERRKVEYSEDYEVWWKHYPADKKGDKEQGFKIWQQLESSVYPELTRATANAAKSDTKYLPHAYKFLRGEYWRGYLTKPKSAIEKSMEVEL